MIAPGDEHTCGLAAGNVYCWGSNSLGQMGGASAGTVPSLIESTSSYQYIASGSYHSCAITTGGDLHCWGTNTFGTIGDGTKVQASAPVTVSLPARPTALQLSWASTCADLDDGRTYCWGYAGDGRLRIRGQFSVLAPHPIDGGGEFVQSSAARIQGCGVSAKGLLECWGKRNDENYGQNPSVLARSLVLLDLARLLLHTTEPILSSRNSMAQYWTHRCSNHPGGRHDRDYFWNPTRRHRRRRS